MREYDRLVQASFARGSARVEDPVRDSSGERTLREQLTFVSQ